MTASTALVETLTAEVRVLMVGNRQVTLSVYRQLDRVNAEQCQPFGRVNDSKDGDHELFVVGVNPSGELVRSSVECQQAQPWIAPRVILGSGTDRYHDSGKVMVDGVEIGVSFRNGRVAVEGYDSPSAAGHWRLENRDAALASAREALAKWEPIHRQWSAWKELPLIVLAGLR